MAYAERPLGPIAAPLSWGFAAAAHARRFAYDHGLLQSEHAGVFTISVGGIEAGGSGKTPIAGWFLDACKAAGFSPGLVTRGYGRSTRGLAVADGASAIADEVGDEPAMLARDFGVPVAAVANRIEGARALVTRGCDALVLDDGFSHRRLRRDLDVVVLRAEAPFSDRRLLPAGTLRESPAGLKRAHVVWFHTRSSVIVNIDLPQTALRVTSEDSEAQAFDSAGAAVALRGVRVVAACAIARPSGFAGTLARAGAKVTELVSFPDHHRYSSADVASLQETVRKQGAAALVVTAKDATKLTGACVPLWTVRVSVRIVEGEQALRQRLADARAGAT
ncbi:MAG: tetraacyldisaccharide 4'-kinase [Clostridia bacterium]|nr:tetraacyldisaccharide 4'-kinase [Deltaproteobacteria bacterium]